MNNWQELLNTFLQTNNEEGRSKLVRYMEQILYGLHDFLNKHVGITEELSLKALSDQFMDSNINQCPEKKLEEVITGLIENIAPHAVNIASPYFVGHMTSAIPFFMVHLKTISAALNQNVVKLETSKVVSVLEKQILAKIHRLVYKKDDAFYNAHVQNTQTTLGAFIEDGTLANITALWTARNKILGPHGDFKGIEQEGLLRAYQYYNIEQCVILVSRLAHYSIRKAAGVLGIGNENIIAVDIDNDNRVSLADLEKNIKKLKSKKGTCIIAVVGIAGTTETGTIDPLMKIAKLCEHHHLYFHVDAAWGGPTLMSEKYAYLLDGIQLADSVTIDGHKQFYMPMSCGMVYFKNPSAMDTITYHANYINRPGSVDLGIKSLAGSREANSIILDSALKIMGSNGYARLINHGIETAKEFATEIQARPNFHVVTKPELNILTYRMCPENLKKQLDASSSALTRRKINSWLNKLNRRAQRMQRESGKSFVSRTTLRLSADLQDLVVVLRVVLMNPMTHIGILKEILDEQEQVYLKLCQTPELKSELAALSS